MTPTAVEVEPKSYYSTSKGLVIRATKGERVVIEGELQRINEKIICFQAINDEHGGYTTSDPDEIRVLDARVRDIKDVMNAEQYNDFIIPDPLKVSQLRQTNDQQSRQIEEQNRIIADLRRTASANGKVPVPVKQ